MQMWQVRLLPFFIAIVPTAVSASCNSAKRSAVTRIIEKRSYLALKYSVDHPFGWWQSADDNYRGKYEVSRALRTASISGTPANFRQALKLFFTHNYDNNPADWGAAFMGKAMSEISGGTTVWIAKHSKAWSSMDSADENCKMAGGSSYAFHVCNKSYGKSIWRFVQSENQPGQTVCSIFYEVVDP